MQVLTDKMCKKIIKKLGIEFGVCPRLIATRLLNDRDKDDMRVGDLSIEALKLQIRAWIECGMPDVANGKTTPMR